MNVDPLAKRNASFASCHDVCKYISELGISKVTSRLQNGFTNLEAIPLNHGQQLSTPYTCTNNPIEDTKNRQIG